MPAPLVLTDLSTPAADAATLTATAQILAPSCDAVLVGDHQDRPDFPPSLLARMIADCGVHPWVTLACRDRNRIVLEQELHGLSYDGLATVLCVTGTDERSTYAPTSPRCSTWTAPVSPPWRHRWACRSPSPKPRTRPRSSSGRLDWSRSSGPERVSPC